MVDVLTRKQRSYNMSRIRSKNTIPEITLRKRLYSASLRGYRLHYKVLGRPDIAYPKKKVAVFVDGCFWHKCPKCFTTPSSNKQFWLKKIGNNVRRDRRTDRVLTAMGWRVLRFYEHEVKNNLNGCYQLINMTIKKRRLGGN